MASVPLDVTGVPAIEMNASELDSPTDVTVPFVAGAAQDAVVPLEVRSWPTVPMGSLIDESTPSPRIKSPTDVIGLRALKAGAFVV
jgi:hypothetical protein